MEENDRRISLLERLKMHAVATAKYSIYYGEGRDTYDVRGRTAHEIIFNPQRRQFPLPQHPAGFFPVQHLDARAGVGHVRLGRAIGIHASPGR